MSDTEMHYGPHKAIIEKKKEEKKENKQKYQRCRIKTHKLEEIKIKEHTRLSSVLYHFPCVLFT